MSETIKHIRKSQENISKKYPDFYNENKETIDKLVTELHKWFDEFSRNPLAEKHGYVDINCMKHRRERHHIEGIRWAEEIFTKRYGEEFRGIILEEGKIHVIDDMKQIYEMGDYYKIGFWKEVRGF